MTLSSNMTSDISRLFPNPYDYVIGINMLTIEFYGYQDRVNFTHMDNCIKEANDDVIRKVLGHQQAEPMGPDPYVWSSGDVSLSMFPEEQLTWSKWSLVPGVVGRFTTENGLKGTQFILLWHELGPIGYGQLVASSDLRSLTTYPAVNRFPDPHDITIQSIGLTVEFYGYRASIFPKAVGKCISAAINDVLQHVPKREEMMIIEAPYYSYSIGEVNLFLTPEKDLKWGMWAFVPYWMQEYVAANGYRGTQFILLWDGVGHVGTGQLTNTSTDGSLTPRLGIS